MLGLKRILTFCAISCITISCGTARDSSQLRMTNGIDNPDQDPAVVLLHFGQGNICTGTYISDSIILTAAH